MRINMYSPIYEVVAVKRKTYAEGLKNLKVGNKIQFDTYLQGTSGSRGSVQATIFVTNLDTGERFGKDQSMLRRLINNTFELKEI